MWSKIGQNKMAKGNCHCGKAAYGSFQAQIEETVPKYFRTSDESSQQLCMGEGVATKTVIPSVNPIYRTTATNTSRTTLGPENNPYLFINHQIPEDNYYYQNLHDNHRLSFQACSQTPRQTGFYTSTSSPQKTEGQIQMCGVQPSAAGSTGLCICCGVPKAMCPNNTVLCTCCGVPKAMCPNNTGSVCVFNPGVSGFVGGGGNCGCGLTGGKPGLGVKELKNQLKQLKNEEKRRKKAENDRLKKEKKEENRIRKEHNKRKKEERKRLRIKRKAGLGGEACNCCSCRAAQRTMPVQKAVPRAPTCAPACAPRLVSTMMYNQKAPAITSDDLRHDFHTSNDKLLAKAQSNNGCFRTKSVSSCHCLNKIANYSVLVHHTESEYIEMVESVDSTRMERDTSSSAMEIPPRVQIGNGDSKDSEIIETLLNINSQNEEPETNCKGQSKQFVPPCVLYLDCTKVKDMCVIIRDKYEEI
ncbi:hypothetical protein GE061_011613 [Apolygus lucorum]|uniref:Uncharacterized protein n=1 Tax=Apolygus lucorum TaxID=248454 RepID=A0A6A4KB71_APOLU|nr:hypothetical protein GE061_011613 [Apolygus lucorum]